VGYLCHLFECRNLAAKSSGFALMIRNASGGLLFSQPQIELGIITSVTRVT
jgi:hypothetical protein